MSRQTSYPVRVKSANGKPEELSQFFRRCAKCGASFIGLMAGKTGERGLWSGNDWKWFCSLECAPQELRDVHAAEMPS